MIEYSSEFKNNHQTAYLAGEYERLQKEADELHDIGLADETLHDMVLEDEARVRARQKEVLTDIEQILEKDKETEAEAKAIVLEFRAGADRKSVV